MLTMTSPNHQRMELIIQRFRAIGCLLSQVDDGEKALDHGALLAVGLLVEETAERAMELMDALPRVQGCPP